MKRPSFGERLGKVAPRTALQVDSISPELRYALWDAMYLTAFKDVDTSDFHYRRDSDPTVILSYRIWNGWLKRPIDNIPSYWHDTVAEIRKRFFEAEWYDAFGFVEFVADYLDNVKAESLRRIANNFMEREVSGYRFVGDQISPIVDDVEISEIQTALDSPKSKASEHLHRALELLSDKKQPDYRNSIKESVSAIESSARQIVGAEHASLPEALKILAKQHPIHSALHTALVKLYGYTSDADGIRHAMSEESRVDETDARFMLVVCSAFVNYLRVRSNDPQV